MNIRERAAGPAVVMQALVAVYLVTLGVLAINAYNTPTSEFARSVANLFGARTSSLDLAVAIAEVVAGVIIFLGLFPIVADQLIYFSAIVIAVLWVIRVVYHYFFQESPGSHTLIWLNQLSIDLLVAAGLWLVAGRYR